MVQRPIKQASTPSFSNPSTSKQGFSNSGHPWSKGCWYLGLLLLLLCISTLHACLGMQGPPRFGAKGPFGVSKNQSAAWNQGDYWNKPSQGMHWNGNNPRKTPPERNAQTLKDGNPSLWRSDHLWVRHFRHHYSQNSTVLHALKAGHPYLPAIRRVFRSQGLPEELAYLPMLESLYDVNANSGSAVGMWQFTRQTAKHVGLRVGGGIDERRDWRKATLAAARYLNELGGRFQYDWGLALAAYNCGPGCIDNAIKRQGTRRFFNCVCARKPANMYLALWPCCKWPKANILTYSSSKTSAWFYVWDG